MSIRFINVTKSFKKKVVLQNLSFEVLKGEILFILGKSGMGKSVALKQIVGILKPDAGQIWVDETEVTSLKPKNWIPIRRKCGMVFQHPALFDSMTILENVSFGLQTPDFVKTLPQPLSQDAIRDRVIEKLELVHLGKEILTRMPSELSYGMQKRVSLARTLVTQPSYLLFDEPTTGLDPITTQSIHHLIFELSRTLNVTSLVVSHDIACALKIADRILVLDQAHLVAHQSVSEIQQSPIPLIRDFLDEALGNLARK